MSESKSIRILYMEDDPGLARLFQKKLEREGYLVDLAHDGEEGLTMYATGSYDMVAVDQNMPIQDGLEVIRVMASQGPLPPTVMVTGTGDEKVAVEAMKLGAQDYIVKDIDGRYLDLLPTVIEQVLQQQRLVEEKQRAEEALRRQNEYLAALHETTLGLISRLDLNDLLEALISRAGQLLGAPHGYIQLVESFGSTQDEPEEAEIECRVGVGVFSETVGFRMKPGEGLAGKVWQTGQPLVVDDYNTWPDRASGFGHDLIRAIMGAPLKSESRVVGVIAIAYDAESDRTFGEEEVELLNRFAQLASLALDNARLFEEAQANQDRLISLQEASQLLVSTPTLEGVIQATLVMATYVGAQQGDLILLDVRDQPMLYSTIPEWVQLTPEQAQVLARQILTSRIERWVLEHRQSALILDTTEDPRWLVRPGHEVRDPIRSAICVPLFDRHGEIMGTLSYTHPQPRAFGPEEQRLAEALADQVTISLENARLYEIARRRAEEAETLYQAGGVVAATLRQDEAIEYILQELARVVPYDSASVQLLREEGYLEIVGGRGWPDPEAMLGLRFPVPGDNPHSVVIQQRLPYKLADGPAAYAIFRKDTHSHVRSWLGAPLIVRDRVIGMLAVDSTQPDYFTSNHARLAAAFADQVAIAIENARLYQEVQQEKQYFEAVVLNSPAAIVVTDLDHNVISWNPAADRLFGYTQTEAIGRNIDDLVTTEAIREEAVAYSQQTAMGGSIHAITRRSRRDGTLVDVELFAVPVVVEGKQVGGLAIYHDITELQGARQEAEAANQAKSAFLATMSHEIRTPMNAVIGMTSLLLDTELTLEQRDFAETIRISGDALLTIINDILDFSKIEASRMELENQPLDLRRCLEGALDLVAPTASEKGLDLAYLVDNQVPAAIVGDVTRLRQILVNLLSNAVKFTEQGEVVVSVNAHPLSPQMNGIEGKHELHFAVRDTGIGIPLDRMGRLFRSFSQVDASTTRRYGGTGLGLAISKRLSELMGGTMWVESEVGKGSTFHFTIKVEAAPIPTPAYLQGVQPNLNGKRLLIVDDNATNRRILTLQAQSWGMLPRDTASPAEALNWIRQGEPFDVAILDMQMPEMDGLMLAAEIRHERDVQALPLVMLSSLGQSEVGDDTEGLELVTFLTKPIKASQLYNVLGDIFAVEAWPTERRDETAKPQFDPEMGKQLPLRILLAEDNAVNQKLALRLLERMGYRADVAANGLEAIEALRRQSYDVVLMDVQMPEMDGLEATRIIRQEWPPEQRLRIIAMTAGAMEEDREACLAAGMDDYISKPIRVEELVSALNKCRPLEEMQGSEMAKRERTEVQ